MNMHRRRHQGIKKLAVAGVLSAGALVWAVDGSSGQQPHSTFEFSPQQGPPGVTISVSGTCLPDGQPTETAFVRLARITGGSGNTPFDKDQSYPVGSDGSWSGMFVVPVEAPPDDYTFSLSCVTQDQVFVVTVIDRSFVVTDEPPITTPPTTPPTTSTTSTTTTVAPIQDPEPPPATAVHAQPAFAG